VGAYRDENEKRHVVLQVKLCELERESYIRKKEVFQQRRRL
jgi:hypothetical protein